MAGEEKTIYVYDDFSEDEPVLLGKLCVKVIKGGETYSFEYDLDWLIKHKLSISLDPELQPFGGRQFPLGKIFEARKHISG
jgi:serine/threonine-protein kinase HipA